ncbi:SDR family oxidoreductase [uncultured Maritalea sp.]|uniref:SDR family oxidoreductase n=1 Tax=uncultured Maritalea sp. TaxID=757249 RepID=UPI002626BF19|nr:SDR family oxidoreductase [uncultured Maritalea sp.]
MKKIAIVTGGSRGIGAAIAKLLAKSGVDVCLSYQSDVQSAGAVVETCKALGVRALAFKADVASAGDVQSLFQYCDQQLGAANILINNAGIVGEASDLVDLKPDVLERVFAVNLYGAVYCCQEAIKRMAKSRGGNGGSIVNISSMAAKFGSPNEYIHYAASKGALDSLTIGLAKEVGPEGIRVNAVHSGTADTDIHERTGNPGRPAMVASINPLGRVARPEEIAEATVWLALDKSSYTNGAIMPVTGGM